MTAEHQPRQGRVGPDPALQPRNGDSAETDQEQVLLAELQKVENRQQAERVERLLADAELIGRLQLMGFDTDSADWRELAQALAEYGYSVFVGWGRSGVLRRMAANHGGRGVFGYKKLPEGLRLQGDDALEVAAELMIVSIETFRTKTLMNPDPNKRWRPDRGASLRTFFVGRCLMELPDVYVKWAGVRRRARLESPGDPEAWAASAVDEAYQRDTQPEVKSISSSILEELNGYDEQAVLMFRLQDDGYSYAEIAEMLTDLGTETTEGAVRSRMHRLKIRAQKEREQWSRPKGKNR